MFIKANTPCINDIVEAHISTVRPLKIGDFGFVYTKNAIMAAQGTIPVEFLLINYLFILHSLLVIALYSKMARKKSQTWHDYGFFHHHHCLEHWCTTI